MHITRNFVKDTYYIGGSERRIALFENIYPLNNGVSYNSYLILDEKTALLDTVDHSIKDLFFENLEYQLNGRPLDYLIINHMEPDHASAIEEVILRHPEVTLVVNNLTLNMVKNFFRTMDYTKVKFLIVKEFDVLDLGTHKLTFVFAPMVHWPEVMMTYDTLTKTLYSADAFGTFGALHGNLFFDEYNFEEDFKSEYRRYFINIVGKYGQQVQAALKKASTVDIDVIAPLHGPIIRKKNDIKKVIDLYNTWSSYEPEEYGTLIAYASIYGNSENAANYIADQLSQKGIKNISLFDVSKTNVSYLVAEAFKYSSLICVASSYNAEVFPLMSHFLEELRAHNYQNRTIALVENGSWAPTAHGTMMKIVEKFKNCRVFDKKVTIKSTLAQTNLELIDNMLDFVKNAAEPQYFSNKDSAFNKISYGLFTVGSKDENRINASIVNTVQLVSDCKEPIISVSISKLNYTAETLLKNKNVSISILNKDTDFSVIQRFGFHSGRNVDKFENFNDYSLDENGLPYLTKCANSYLSGEVINYIEVEDHYIFFIKVTSSVVLNKVESLTYEYYYNNIKPKNKQTSGSKVGWRCVVCGYIYEGEDIPEDYICPLCKHGIKDFEKINY